MVGLKLVNDGLRRNVDGVDHKARSTAVAGEVSDAEHRDGDVATFAVDEAHASDADGGHA